MEKHKISQTMSIVLFVVAVVFLGIGIYKYTTTGLEQEPFMISALALVLGIFRLIQSRRKK